MFEIFVVNAKMLGPIKHSEIFAPDPDQAGTYIKIDFSPASDQTQGRRLAQMGTSLLAWPVRGKGNYDPGWPRPVEGIITVITVSGPVLREFLRRAQQENQDGRWNWYQAYTNNCQDHTTTMLTILDQIISG